MRESSEEMAREEMRGSEQPPIASALTTSRDDAVVASRRPDLDDQLEALQSDANEQYQAYRRTHEHLWKLLVRTL
jgi:hypothetical protein